jgi:zeta-carotene desaturase
MASLVPFVVKDKDNGDSFLSWLQKHGQTERAIARFWNPILVSALSEDLDRISVSAAAQVVRESMKSVDAGRMGIPMIPLTELYAAAQEYITKRGGDVKLRCGVDTVGLEDGVPVLKFADGTAKFDFAMAALLPPDEASQPLREKIAHFESSSITGIHLWFDRKVTELPHAVLLDRTIQWMFHKSELQERGSDGSYIELVVSSSKELIEKSRQEIIDLALSEVREFFPEARSANLVKSTVIKEVNATYSPRPGIDGFRPGHVTEWHGVFLAGDWTATGWPATMEGAVRSGYGAAEAVLRGKKFLVADLGAGGLMRLFG